MVVKLAARLKVIASIILSKNAMAPHSSTLAWKIPWTEEHGRLQSMAWLQVGHDWATSLSRIGEGNGNPLQCSCLENPGMGEPGGLPSMGSHRVGPDWSDLAAAAAEVSKWAVWHDGRHHCWQNRVLHQFILTPTAELQNEVVQIPVTCGPITTLLPLDPHLHLELVLSSWREKWRPCSEFNQWPYTDST